MGTVMILGMRTRRSFGAVALLMAAACAVAVEPSADLSLELVADGFSRPVALSHAGDGSNRFFVVEQEGRILIIDDGVVLGSAFFDISSLVDSSANEQGLLGLAFHPDFADNGYFFVNYTHDPAGSGPDVTRVSRFEVSAEDPNITDTSSETILLQFEQPASNHNGGDLHFGPDGYLYIATGDGGGSRDQFQNAQDLGSLLGKMLRIDVNGGSPYAIPAGNPFVDAVGARPEIWAYGLRNPWRFSFDRTNGDLFIGDVGQNEVEEVDFQPASSTGGENYGWSCREGDDAPDFNPCDGSPLMSPILVYDHGEGCSVTGGYRYRGSIATLAGKYVYGDFCSGRIWFASDSSGTWSAEEWANTNISISAFGEDEEGELYVADLGRGEIYRFVGPSKPLVRRTPGRRVRPTQNP